ncbi:MAG: hypothetical protein ABR985_04305 [Methanotrichaceae archaeon]|jgi:hypothetical protein
MLESSAYSVNTGFKGSDESLVGGLKQIESLNLMDLPISGGYLIGNSGVIHDMARTYGLCVCDPTKLFAGSIRVQSTAEDQRVSAEPKEGNANFNGLFSDYPNDLLNLITLAAGINVKKSGNYSIDGSMYDIVNGNVVDVFNSSFLKVGTRFIYLDLAGMKSPGPYRVKKLVLYDGDGNEIDRSNSPYTTRVYNDLDFSSPMAKLDGNYSDYGSDPGHDGLYNYLTVDVGVQVFEPGNYSMMASLYGAEGKEIVWSVGYANFSAGRNIMHLDFDGKTIERQKVNGTYQLKNVTLYRQSPGNGSLAGPIVDDLSIQDVLGGAYVTKAYNYTQFEDPSWPERILSGSGSGEILLTISVKDKIPVFGGRYSMDIVGVSMPPISSNWTVADSKGGYVYRLPGVYMPDKPNNFIVEANGVRDLNVGVKQDRSGITQMAGTAQNRAWVSSRAVASKEGIATLESDFISPGRYQFKVFGDAAENVSQVALEMKVVKKLVIDGRFNLSLNTSGFPSGNYSFSAKALNGSMRLDEIEMEDG